MLHSPWSKPESASVPVSASEMLCCQPVGAAGLVLAGSTVSTLTTLSTHADTCPALSRTRCDSVNWPSLGSVTVPPLATVWMAPKLISYWTVCTPEVASVPLSLKARVLVQPDGSADVSTGMTLSIFTVCGRHADGLPFQSTARVSTWCGPWPVIGTTVPEGPCWIEPSALSTRHCTYCTPEDASVALTVKLTVGVVYQPAIAVVEVSVGAVVSPETSTVTGIERQPEGLPALSQTCVHSVCGPGPSIVAVAPWLTLPLSSF